MFSYSFEKETGLYITIETPTNKYIISPPNVHEFLGRLETKGSMVMCYVVDPYSVGIIRPWFVVSKGDHGELIELTEDLEAKWIALIKNIKEKLE